jgi:hypothetical protein
LFIFLALAGSTAFAQDAAPSAKVLSDYFPADTLLYVEVPSVPALMENGKSTGLYALWHDDAMAGIRAYFESEEGADAETAEFVSMVKTASRVIGSFDGGLAAALVPSETGLELLIVAQLGEDSSAVSEILDEMYKGEAEEGFAPRLEDVSGVASRMSGVDGELTGIADGILFIGGRYAYTGAVDRRKTPSNAGSLTSSVVFTKSSAFFSKGPSVYHIVVDWNAVRAIMTNLAATLPFDMTAMLDALGIDDIDTVSMEGIFALGGVTDHVYISTRNADSRLIDICGRSVFEESRLSAVPRDAIYFEARSNDFKASWESSLDMMQPFMKATGVDFAGGVERIEQLTGVSFERDVLPGLGSASISYLVMPQMPDVMALATGTAFETVSLIEIEDEAAIEQALGKIVAYAKAEPSLLAPMMPMAAEVRVETTVLGNLTIHSLVVGGMQMISPSLAVANGYIVYGNRKDAVIAAVDRLIAPSASVTDSTDYARARSALDRAPAQLAYINLDRIIDIVYDAVLPNLAQMIDRAHSDGSVPFTSADIPAAFRLKKHFDGISSAVVTSGNLIDVQMYSPFGMGVVVTGGVIAATGSGAAADIATVAPGLIPGVEVSPERARLLEIGGRLQLATPERHGRFPDELSEALPPEMLQAPQDSDPASPVDYQYVKGLTAYAPGRTILVYERKGLQGDGRHVLYVDGSVVFLTEDEFQEALTAARETSEKVQKEAEEKSAEE